MAKIRINKLALELKVQNDQIIDELLKRGIPVKNYMSLIEDDAAEEIRKFFSKDTSAKKDAKLAGGGKAKVAPKAATASAAPAKAKIAAKGKPGKATEDGAKVEAKAPETPADTQPKPPAPAAKPTGKKKTSPPTEAKGKKAPAKTEGKQKEDKAGEADKAKGAKKPAVIEIHVEAATAESSAEPAPPSEEAPEEELEKIFQMEDRLKPAAKKFPKKEGILKKREREDEVRAVKKLGLKVVKQDEKHEERPTKPGEKPAAKPAEPAAAPIASKPVARPAEEKPAPVAEPVKIETTAAVEEGFEKVQLAENMPVRDLAEKLKCTPNDIIKELMGFGILATINQSLDLEISSKVADKMGFEVEVLKPEMEVALDEDEEDRAEERTPRPPIVTIMGHVDHGKTSLLDAIRLTKLTEMEKGGITQHIGAYQVKIKNQHITFLDTPGHEAFTAMRARGAQVTDIVVLVVAADDGLKPQTQEAIDHANAAAVPILVAINKIDKPEARPDDVKQQLSNLGLIPEEWGGQTIFSQVSALKKIGIDHLLEMILLQAEVMELKANAKLRGQGVVIESKLDKGRGPVATVIVQKGMLRVGDPIIVGAYFGKVRALINDQGKKKPLAHPSDPVEIVGLPEVPKPGDKLYVVSDERKARQLSLQMLQKMRETSLSQTNRITMEDLHRQIAEGKIKDLNIIIKADTQGSILALKEAFGKLDLPQVRVKVIHGGVGGITESDVLLSTASNAIIIGFNVRPTDQAAALAERDKVDIRMYGIIYDAVNDMKKALDGMLAPQFRERVIGRAVVQQVFSIPKIGVVAGSRVVSGNVERNALARLIRDNVVIYQGKINSLRRFKDDVKEVQSGYECGISLDKYQDIKQDDIIEPYVMDEVRP